MANDIFQGGLLHQYAYHRAATITPNSAEDFAQDTRAVYVGTGGTLNATMPDGVELQFTGLVAGQIYPLRLRRVRAGGSASGLIALW
jgi:hypothetical protein